MEIKRVSEHIQKLRRGIWRCNKGMLLKVKWMSEQTYR